MMNTLDHYGEVLLQQHEGNRQIASALAKGARVSVRRLARLLVAMLRHVPEGHPPG